MQIGTSILSIDINLKVSRPSSPRHSIPSDECCAIPGVLNTPAQTHHSIEPIE